MNFDFSRIRARRRALSVAVLLACTAAACTPPTGEAPPTDPIAPTISTFNESHTRSGAPQVSILRWQIADANKDILTCRIDRDGDGTFDRTIQGCRSAHNDYANYLAPGTYVATLEVTDTSGLTATATKSVVVGSAPTESYDIDLRLNAGMDPIYSAAFESAATRWESIIKAGLYSVPTQLPAGVFDWLEPYNGTIDDLLIDARVEPIDGPGGLLGQAGALLIREDNNKPYFGIMRFDEADMASLAASGRLESTILHEMAHVLGIGGLWLIQGFVNDPLGAQPTFSGNAANSVYQQLSGQTDLIPLETEGGQGTALAHWKESVFGNELLTGYLNSGGNPLSKMTAAALADMGYAIDLTNTDAYTMPTPFLAALRAADAPVGEVEPIAAIDAP